MSSWYLHTGYGPDEQRSVIRKVPALYHLQIGSQVHFIPNPMSVAASQVRSVKLNTPEEWCLLGCYAVWLL
jgi:hypothetical protein